MQRFFLPLSLITMLFISACGVVTDTIRDNEFRIGFLNKPDFVSPYKLRVGITPFQDEVGLGTPDAGPNLARLLTEEFSKDSNLILIPAETMARAISERGFQSPLSAENIRTLGTEMNLHIIIEGSIDQVNKYQVRKGWRRLARFFTSQQQYVDALLSLTSYDASTGIILAARASEANYRVGKEEKDFFDTGTIDKPNQESIEKSLDIAITEAYYRTIDGLAALPFKARISSLNSLTAEIPYGTEVGLRPGQELVILSEEQQLTNSINVTYSIPGPPRARLKVTGAEEGRATLEITEGDVVAGDYAQSWVGKKSWFSK